MNQFQRDPDFPERPCYLPQKLFCRFIGLSKNCLRNKLIAAEEPPLGRLVSPEKQKRACKIVGVPYFFPD
jgi:hypothetical protein